MVVNSIYNLKMKANSNEKRTISEKGYCIVEDTLDENQVFKNVNDGKYGGAPFFIELPVMLIGTNHIENRGGGAVGGAGDQNGDGSGEIQTYFAGSNFKEIVEGDNESKKNAVKETPMTYAILKKDEKNKREKLIINVGKLGEKGDKNLNWGNNEWPERRLERSITDCQNKINQIISGQNSPISNLKTKYTELDNILKKMLARPDSEISKEDKEKIKEIQDDYKKKIIDKSIANDKKITVEDIPSVEKLVAIENLPIDNNGSKLQSHINYANYKKSLENLVKDQKLILKVEQRQCLQAQVRQQTSLQYSI